MKKFWKYIKKIIRSIYGRLFIVRDGFWFIDIPRTSSSSIRVELGEKFGKVHGKAIKASLVGSNDVTQQLFLAHTTPCRTRLARNADVTQQLFLAHTTAKEMRGFLGSAAWNKIFTFTVVRNPWDRTCSMYHYRKRIGDINPEWSFQDYVFELAKAKHDTQYFEYHGYRFGACDYILGDNGEVIVDFVAKYENRVHDLKIIASRLGLEVEDFGELKILEAKPKGVHYSEFYDSEMQNIVGEVYSKDIELFNYSFDDESN
jgi:hypothetical protein